MVALRFTPPPSWTGLPIDRRVIELIAQHPEAAPANVELAGLVRRLAVYALHLEERVAELERGGGRAAGPVPAPSSPVRSTGRRALSPSEAGGPTVADRKARVPGGTLGTATSSPPAGPTGSAIPPGNEAAASVPLAPSPGGSALSIPAAVLQILEEDGGGWTPSELCDHLARNVPTARTPKCGNISMALQQLERQGKVQRHLEQGRARGARWTVAGGRP